MPNFKAWVSNINFYIQKNFYNVKSLQTFSDELYFTNNEVKNILSNKNNQNIYYIVVDGATTLQKFNDNFKEIDIVKENIESGSVLRVSDKTFIVKSSDGAVEVIDHDFKILPQVGEYL